MPSHNSKVFHLDKEVIGILQGHNWRVDIKGYVRCGHSGLLHRLILLPDKNEVIDHINGNPSDCRRFNLRIGTQRENSYNTRLGKNNRTGYKGVSWDKYRGKYVACICVNRKTIHLGRYGTTEEAANAYDNAATIYFGQYALLNKEIKEAKLV
jgi:hypothetical protein